MIAKQTKNRGEQSDRPLAHVKDKDENQPIPVHRYPILWVSSFVILILSELKMNGKTI